MKVPFFICVKLILSILLLQHVHAQADAIREMEELVRLDGTAMARPRSDVRTLL